MTRLRFAVYCTMVLAMVGVSCASDDSNDDASGGTLFPPPATTAFPPPTLTPVTPPPAGSFSDDEAVFDQFTGWVSEGLAGLAGNGPALDCPPDPPFPIFDVSIVAEVGSAQPALEYCASPLLVVDPSNPSARTQAISMKNTSSVPLRVGLSTFGAVVQHLPGEVFSVPLPSGIAQGQTVEMAYRIDSDGIAYTVVTRLIDDYTRPPLPGFISVAACASSPNAACVISNLASILPESIEIRGVAVPLQKIAKIVGTMLQYKPLLDQWQGLAAGFASGRIVLTYHGTG